jgi:hypothetical protein
VSDTAQVELRCGRVQAPACRLTSSVKMMSPPPPPPPPIAPLLLYVADGFNFASKNRARDEGRPKTARRVIKCRCHLPSVSGLVLFLTVVDDVGPHGTVTLAFKIAPSPFRQARPAEPVWPT